MPDDEGANTIAPFRLPLDPLSAANAAASMTAVAGIEPAAGIAG
jgi:hypothetical protein